MRVENPSDLKPGQKVRVSFEAEYRRISFGTSLVYHRNGTSGAIKLEGLKVEVIEPEYIDCEMYVDADGRYWKFIKGVDAEDHLWMAPGIGSSYDFDRPVRPLRRLVPEVGE